MILRCRTPFKASGLWATGTRSSLMWYSTGVASSYPRTGLSIRSLRSRVKRELIRVEVPEDREDAPLPDDWADRLSAEYSKDYWDSLMRFIASERIAHEVYPSPSRTFAAFHFARCADTRVVIIGQDPYHGPGQADGLCFSVPVGIRKPRSLVNIHKEMREDLGVAPPEHGSLEGWARQGILLLNTTLTVRSGEEGSHRGHGWEEFTDQVIRVINEKAERVVFLLWGKDARQKKLIVASRHAVIESAHPRARANAQLPFRGSKPFSRVNQLLDEAGRPFILTKEPLGQAGIYTPSAPPSPSRVTSLERVGSLVFAATGTPGGPLGEVGQVLITGAALSSDGALAVVRTYTDAYLYEVTDGDVVAALAASPVRVALPPAPQGEAIAFDGSDLVVTSEGMPFDVTLVPAVAPTAAATAEASIADVAEGNSTGVTLAIAAVVAALLVGGYSVLRRRR